MQDSLPGFKGANGDVAVDLRAKGVLADSLYVDAALTGCIKIKGASAGCEGRGHTLVGCSETDGTYFGWL